MQTTFYISKISKTDSTEILMSVEALMRLGWNLTLSLETQIELVSGKKKELLKRVVNQIKNKKDDVSETLKKAHIISEEEQLIIKNSKDTKEAISNILEMRKLSKTFDKTITSLISFPIFAWFVGLLIAHNILPIVFRPIDDMMKIAKLKRGIDLESTLNIPPVFFYVYHPESIMPIFVISIVVIFLLIVIYFYLSSNHPSVLYKLFKLKAFDDIPFMFTLMHSLKSGGIDINKVTELLSKSKISRGWRLFFIRLNKQVLINKPIYKEFEKFGIPKDITIVLKVSEVGKDFWDTFKSTIEYAKQTNENKNKLIRDRYSGISKILAYTIVIYFVLGLLLLLVSMQNIISAMQFS